MSLIRKPQFSDAFYPADPIRLEKMVEQFLNQANIAKSKEKIRALIVPHAGYIYSGPVAAYGYKMIRDFSYSKVILIGPSHHFSFEGLAIYPKGEWETPLGKVKTLSLSELDIKNNHFFESEDIHQPEHCLEVQLPFLQKTLNNFQISPILMQTAPKKTGEILNNILDKETLLIVSSDLSHYLPYSEAKIVDKVTLDAILANDPERFENYGEACGKIPIKILLEISFKNKWQPKLLCYLNSGDTSGDKQAVVGYAALSFFEKRAS